jgi:transcriptional regulator with XRE-family HTH domain
MDDLRVGQLLRAVRKRRGLSQAAVAGLAGISQQLVAALESGRIEGTTVRTLRRLGTVLEIYLPFEPRWRGGSADRLLDRAHAALVERVVAILRRDGWEVIVEYTFSHFGERGAIDIVAWHAASRTLVVIEIKPRLFNVQNLLSTMDRKARLARLLLARERGWQPLAVGRLVVMNDTTANRGAVRRHREIFATSLPAGSRTCRRWLRQPEGSLAGIWFLSPTTGGGETSKRRHQLPRPTTHRGE